MNNPLYWDKWKEFKSKTPMLVSTIVIVVMAVSFGIIGAYTYWFFEHYYIQSPITFATRCGICQKPTPTPRTVIKYIKVTPTPIKESEVQGRAEIRANSEYEIVMKQKHGDTLWNIYQLETERGKTDYCRIKGNGYGGFGVMTAGKVVCYPTFEKAVERANYWYDQILSGRTQAQALCKWSGHGDVHTCAYYNNFLTL